MTIDTLFTSNFSICNGVTPFDHANLGFKDLCIVWSEKISDIITSTDNYADIPDKVGSMVEWGSVQPNEECRNQLILDKSNTYQLAAYLLNHKYAKLGYEGVTFGNQGMNITCTVDEDEEVLGF